jgi:uncharacterized protein (TIGR00251 family)
MTREVDLPIFVKAAAGGWQVLVRVRPGAKRTEFAGLMDGRLCVRLAAPAVENKANKALLAFMAGALGLRCPQVTLLSGERGREKRLHIATDTVPDWSRLPCL